MSKLKSSLAAIPHFWIRPSIISITLLLNYAGQAKQDHQNGKKNIHLVSMKDSVSQRIGALILKQIYSELNIPLTVMSVPGKRAHVEVKAGRKDGEVMRIFEYGDELPNLIRVSTPYYRLETMPFKKLGSPIIIKTKEDLKKYRVVTIRGVKKTDLMTKGHKKLTKVKSSLQMLKFLAAGRADIALASTKDGVLQSIQSETLGIVKAGRPLAEFNLYHYLNKKHEKLAKKIDQKLKTFQKNGRLKKIVQKAEEQAFEEVLSKGLQE